MVVRVVLSGMTEAWQMEENIKTFEKFHPLSDRELAAVEEAAAKIRAMPTIPCTNCGYCSGCPNEIDIPEILRKYNSYTYYENKGEFAFLYGKDHPPGRSAADCTECGNCVTKCPQSIDIPAGLKDAAELYEMIRT